MKAGKVPVPAVLEVDQQGNLLQAWGVPGQGGSTQGKDRPFPAQWQKIDWSAGQHFFKTDSKGTLFTHGLFMPQKFVLKNLPNRTPSAPLAPASRPGQPPAVPRR